MKFIASVIKIILVIFQNFELKKVQTLFHPFPQFQTTPTQGL